MDSGQRVKPINTIVHERWTGDPLNGHDIALLELPEDSKHQPVILPTESQTYIGGQIFVALGLDTQVTNGKANALLMAEMEFLENEECDELLDDVDVAASMMCAFAIENINVCHGQLFL